MIALLAVASALAVQGFAPVDDSDGPFAGLEKQVRLTGKPTLLDALDQVSAACDVRILLDKPALQGRWGEVDPKDLPLEFVPGPGSGNVVLRRALQPLDLRPVKMGDHLLVTSAEMAMHRLLAQRVSVPARPQPLHAALRDLSRQTGATIVVDPRVMEQAKATTAVGLEDVTLEGAVRVLAELAGLKLARIDTVIFVTSPASASSIRLESGDGSSVPPFEPVPRAFPGAPGGGLGALPAPRVPLPAPETVPAPMMGGNAPPPPPPPPNR